MSGEQKPVIAQKSPFIVDVTAGEEYFWCTCGKSKKQPFCDGRHKGSGFMPLRWTAEEDGKKSFCGCKMTRDQPFCDGSHNDL